MARDSGMLWLVKIFLERINATHVNKHEPAIYNFQVVVKCTGIIAQ